MSGIEVTGIVLGGIPLIISGLEHYCDGVNTIRRLWNTKREIKSLIRILRAEHVSFLGTCRRVLYGLVPETQIDLLIDVPHSSRWKEQTLDRKLRQRLQRAYEPFIECMDDMTEALDTLRADLKLDADSQPIPVANDSFQKNFKAFKFALSQRRFNDSIERIRYNNNILASLTSQNLEMESLRSSRHRPVSKHFKLVQKHAKSLYGVIERSWQCRCPCSHSANLCLDARLLDDVACRGHSVVTESSFNFNVVFSTDSESGQELPWSWHETEVRPLDIKDDGKLSDQLETTEHTISCSKNASRDPLPGTRSSLKSILRKGVSSGRKNVQFTPDQATDHRITGVSLSTIPAAPIASGKPGELILSTMSREKLLKLNEISDLCQALQDSMKVAPSKDEHCLGFFNLGERQALAFHRPKMDGKRFESHAIQTVKDILSIDKTVLGRGNFLMSWADRLEMALTVASSVLQLQQTPWLRDNWTKEDFSICSAHTEETKPYVFITKTFPVSQPIDANPAKAYIGLPRNNVLFALGIFLIELSLGQSFESLRTDQDPLDANGKANILTNWSAANRLIRRVGREAGLHYSDAVRRCIHCDFNHRCTDLEDDDFRQAVYDGVVAPLQEDAQNFKS